MEAVVSFRFGAYRKHRPVVAEEMRTPEEGDLDPNSVVLYAKDKQSGEIVGSVRIESNFGGRHALADHLHLPEQIDGKPVAYITRLAVAHGPTGRLAKLGLFKAIYQYCLGLQIDYLTAAAPVPLDRQYASLGFSPIYPNARLFPGFTDPSILYVPMKFDVKSSYSNWKKQNHPLFQFMMEDYCPDIKVFTSVSAVWVTPREPRPAKPITRLDQLLKQPFVVL